MVRSLHWAEECMECMECVAMRCYSGNICWDSLVTDTYNYMYILDLILYMYIILHAHYTC